jgi:hypothetical protein
MDPCTHLFNGEAQPTQPCSRCGGFVCGSCRAFDAPVLCSDCQNRIHDPVLRSLFEPISTGRAGARLFAMVLPQLLIVSAAFAVPLTVVNHYTRTAGGSGIVLLLAYTWTLGLLPNIAAVWLMAGAANGQRHTLSMAVFAAWRGLPRVAAAEIRVLLNIGLYMLPCTVPGFIPWTSGWVTLQAACFEEGDAVARSKELTAGRRWEVFAVGVVGMFITVFPLAVASAIFHRIFARAEYFALVELGLAFVGLMGVCFRIALALATFYGLRNGSKSGQTLIMLPAR